MISRLLLACALALMAPSAAAEAVKIVYLGLEDDPFYERQEVYTGLSLKDRHRPVDGARLAIRGTRILSRALGLTFELEEVLLGPDAEPARAVAAARESGALAILLDLPEAGMRAALEAPATTGSVLFNIRHGGRAWREARCRRDLLHTLPSDDMLSDALAQHLRVLGWQRVVLLHGEAPEDLAHLAAARRSIEKFGLKPIAEKVFRLSNDPRQRDLNNIRLLTAEPAHDVVWLIDEVGEFGRYVPYATHAPVPVVGSEGLTPVAWHWTYERHGAPQLNQRFRRQSDRDMSSLDWAAWAAVRAVVESVSRTRSGDPAQVIEHLRGEALSLDLYKGVPGSFRAWNGQLRQPVLLATANAVISIAPHDAFKHEHNALDSLGIDAPDDRCGM